MITLLAAVLVSYPFVALFGNNAGVFAFVPIFAILVTFLATANRVPNGIAVAIKSAIVATAFSLTYFIMAEPHDAEKMTAFLQTLLVFGIMLGVCLRSPPVLERLPAASLIVGGAGAFLIATDAVLAGAGRLAYGEANPIWVARAISLAGIAGAWFITRRKPKGWLILGAATIAIVLTGSRGPLLGLLASASFGIVFLTQGYRASATAKTIYGIAVLLLLNVALDIIPTDLRIFSGTDTGRGAIYAHALDIIGETPEGLGVGGFQYYHFRYPHNLFLEFLAEWGWFLGGAWIFAICLGGFRLIKAPGRYDILKLAFVAELLNSQVSGDITSPRMLYALVFVGFIASSSQVHRPRHEACAATTPS